MAKFTDLAIPDDGKLSHNIIHFARALRAAGLPIGPGRVLDAVRAVEVAGFSERRDFFWTLHACFVSRPEQREVFRQIFRLYWRDPRYLEHMIAALAPSIRGVREERKAQAAERRAAEALLEGVDRPAPDMPDAERNERIEIDASRTASSRERLRHLDFELMSGEEMIAARRMLSTLTLPVHPLRSRRTHPARHGPHPDWRATMRQAVRRDGQIINLCARAHRIRWPNLVALCDISGSMSHYSRAVLHFLHAIANRKGPGWAKVHAFTFGTRLTNITRHLRHRDVDMALAAVGAQAQDWNGGTRIGACLRAFNRDWSRRVLSQGAVVLLITDGLDRDDPEALADAMDRLRLSARRLIWLNPLLRWDGFAPRVRGIQVMLPRVDSFRAGHNVASLEALAEALSRPEDTGEKARLMAASRMI
ncbi:MAG: VWA domain-containing protein [Pseudomonadota bacterium]